jgi:hypothetical protein
MAEIVTAVVQAHQPQELLSGLVLWSELARSTRIRGDRLDVVLELGPAREAVAASDDQLSIGETEVIPSLRKTRMELASKRQRRRLILSELALKLAGFVVQMLETGVTRKTAKWQSERSSRHARCPPNSGQEVRS